MAWISSLTTGEAAAPDALAGGFSEPSFHRLSQEELVGVKCKMEAGMAFEPALHLGMLMSRVVCQ